MLTFNNVDFSYPHQQIFNDLNFEMAPGEFSFLIGRSGAGKSTLLQMIYMNIKPDSGYIQFGEFDSKTIKPGKLPLLRRKIGIIFQDFKLLADRNIYDNLAFILEVTNTPRREIKKRVNNALTD